MRKTNSYFRLIMVVITNMVTLLTWSIDTLELEKRAGIKYTYNGIKYLLNNGTATVCGSVKEMEYITIPSSIQYKGKTYQVTEIDVCAFLMWDAVNRVPTNPKLKKIVLPKTIIKIGDYAFSGERKLEEINIPNSVKEIGLGVFQKCKKLKSINIPNGVKEIKKNIRFSFAMGLQRWIFHLQLTKLAMALSRIVLR